MITHGSRATRITPHRTGGVVLCLWICLLLLAAATAPAAESASTAALYGDLRMTVDDDGLVVLWTENWLVERSLLKISPPWTSVRRRAAIGDSPSVLRLAHEGVENGSRGFSRRADDDSDGRTDEDRLDGVDNDGDGLVDEDFAAVSDQMHVVHRTVGGEVRHLETYHWDYEHLCESLVVSWTLDGGPSDAVLRLPEGAWHEARVGWCAPKRSTADPAARPMAVARLVDEHGEWWLGVSVLEGDAVLRMDGGELRLTAADHMVIAVSATPTLTQLRNRQATVFALHAGARSAPDADPVPWIVPPPTRTPETSAPTALHHASGDGSTVVEITTPPGWSLIPDPESFRISGVALGAPRRIRWQPGVGTHVLDEIWPAATAPATLRRDHILLPLVDDVSSGGVWTFTFPPTILPDEAATLAMRSVSGRNIDLVLMAATNIQPPMNTPEPPQGAPEESIEENMPSLSPHLLENYPNPFVDLLQVRFKIPETVGEGFVWDEDKAPLLAPTDLIPYTSSQPRVTLKIYNVAGNEVASVFDEPCDPGERTASWNGLDVSGRPVATGTYFCKLQIENWSVTKRVALIR